MWTQPTMKCGRASKEYAPSIVHLAIGVVCPMQVRLVHNGHSGTGDVRKLTHAVIIEF